MRVRPGRLVANSILRCVLAENMSPKFGVQCVLKHENPSVMIEVASSIITTKSWGLQLLPGGHL